MPTVNLNSNFDSYKYQLTSTANAGTYFGTATGTQASVTVPDGQYALQLSNPTTNATMYSGYINTAVNTNVYAPCVVPADSVSSGVASTPVVASTGPLVIQTPATVSEEFIAPNSNFGKYFTCEDARISIGDMFIDEAVFVQYTLQDSQIPIYGYRSRFYDALAQGRSIVQGQIGLNFVSEGYLYAALTQYATYGTTPPSGDQATLNGLIYTQYQLLNTAGANTSQLSAMQAQTAALVTKLGPNSLDIANNYVANALQQQTTPSSTGYINAVYANVPFDLVLTLNGAQRTVTRKLEGCVLTGNDQVIDTSGNTLSDGYSFIARRLR
jgi:hypothetical protein